jgi:CheY-like chemotaxis protein
LKELKTKKYDCIILDLFLPDIYGYDLLKKFEAEGLSVPPVIIYSANKDITPEEEFKLRKYTDSIIIKSVKSEERLLDETALFLHQVVGKMPKKKRDIIKKLHDKDAIFQKRRIFLVDDDMRNVFAISHILEEKGMEVISAINGKKAVDILKKDSNFDLVLMDIMMPEMDGYEAMKQIRSKLRLNDLPIIALTAKAMKEDKVKCLAAGANDYLSKPVETDRLLSLMRVWLYK